MPIKLKTCVAGCGRMGEPMLAALLAGGVNAQGFDIRVPHSYGDFGKYLTDQPAEVAPDTRVLISVVRDVAQTQSLLFGEQGLLARLPALEYLVISSTLSPRYISGLKTRISAVKLVDAPMSGAAIAAQQARLSFMLGGADADIAALMPLFECMGQHFHQMGPVGSGMTGKVLNNLVAAGSVALTRTALEWAQIAGLDQQKLLGLMHTSSGQNWFASGFDDIEFAKDGYDPFNSIGLLKKDVEAAMDVAADETDTELAQAVIAKVLRLEAFGEPTE